jgi:hypothetical protein
MKAGVLALARLAASGAWRAVGLALCVMAALLCECPEATRPANLLATWFSQLLESVLGPFITMAWPHIAARTLLVSPNQPLPCRMHLLPPLLPPCRQELQAVLAACWRQAPGLRDLLGPPLLLLAVDSDGGVRQAGLAFWDEALPLGLAGRLQVRGLPAAS